MRAYFHYKKTHIVLVEALFYYCHLQSLQWMERVMCIWKIPLFGVSLLLYWTSASVYEYERILNTLGTTDCSCLICKHSYFPDSGIGQLLTLSLLVLTTYNEHCKPTENMVINKQINKYFDNGFWKVKSRYKIINNIWHLFYLFQDCLSFW